MKNTALSLVLAAIIAGQALALPMEDIHVGAVYYHNAWNNNNKVRVLDIRGSSVKVQFLEGSNAGAIEFVTARDLMTPSQSSEEALGDAGEAIVGGAIILCAIFGCGSESSKKPARTTPKSRIAGESAHLKEMRRVLGDKCEDLYWEWRKSADRSLYSAFAYSSSRCGYSVNARSKASAERTALEKCGSTCSRVAWHYYPK